MSLDTATSILSRSVSAMMVAGVSEGVSSACCFDGTLADPAGVLTPVSPSGSGGGPVWDTASGNMLATVTCILRHSTMAAVVPSAASAVGWRTLENY